MWICSQCGVQNSDQERVCSSCGATRAAGRFRPRISSGGQRRPATPQPPAQAVQRPPAAARLGRLTGVLLLILLPLWTALIAWRQAAALAPVLVPLALPASVPGWLGGVCYILMALTATLLSLLPGLWTLLLSRPPLPPRSQP